jgi:DNA-binding HxlR family transcriptional regulator
LVPTARSYHDACPIGRSLDVVGERWALLVVRELLLGPQRFGDLRHALPGVSSNLLTDRLRELEAHGVLARRKLPPPAGAVVYELTDSGRELEPVLLALGQWGARMPLPESPTLSATSVLLYLRGSRRPDPRDAPTTYAVELDGRPWTVTTAAGEVQVEAGDPTGPAARLRTDPHTLNALLADPALLDARLADRSVAVDGDLPAVRRLLAPAP